MERSGTGFNWRSQAVSPADVSLEAASGDSSAVVGSRWSRCCLALESLHGDAGCIWLWGRRGLGNGENCLGQWGFTDRVVGFISAATRAPLPRSITPTPEIGANKLAKPSSEAREWKRPRAGGWRPITPDGARAGRGGGGPERRRTRAANGIEPDAPSAGWRA